MIDAVEVEGEAMIQFVIGLFIGAVVVVFVMALICAAGDEREGFKNERK